MRTVSGLFDSRAQGEQAVADLESSGISSSQISVVAPDEESESGAAEGVTVGAAVGGVGGLLAGLGVFAIPGIGPVVGAGWLAATLMGAAAGGVAGGLLGSLTDAGIEEEDAHFYAEGVRRGGTLVTARVDEDQADAAAAILGQSGSIDVAQRRAAYVEGGWSGYNPLGGALPGDRIEDDRSDLPPLPR